MTKCIRKSVSILLMAAMVLTTVLSYTPDIVYGQGYEPNLKAKIDGDKLIVYSENANASEVISDVEEGHCCYPRIRLRMPYRAKQDKSSEQLSLP